MISFTETWIAENYVRRAFHSSLLLDDHVYIEGGEITQKVDNTVVKATTNVTLTSDMCKYQTNESIITESIKIISPPNGSKSDKRGRWGACYSQSRSTLANLEQQFFLCFWWGRGCQHWLPIIARALALETAFIASGLTPILPSGNPVFVRLSYADGALGVTMDNTGYILGGFENKHSTQTITFDGGILIPAILTFNMYSG